jgi:hypothetical protein
MAKGLTEHQFTVAMWVFLEALRDTPPLSPPSCSSQISAVLIPPPFQQGYPQEGEEQERGPELPEKETNRNG